MAAWQLIISPELSGAENMEQDLRMFYDFEQGIIPSTLRIYSWKPKCITLGYSQEMDRLIDELTAKIDGWDIVKRPTGGGIVFHNEAEVTYSLVTEIDNPRLPKGLVPSYRKLSEAIVFALRSVGVSAELQTSTPRQSSGLMPSNVEASNFKAQNKSKSQNPNLCFAYPAEYEIVVGDKKIVGSAQKRGKKALLQQGSIFVRNMADAEFELLKKPYKEYNAVSVEQVLGRKVGFKELSDALVKGFKGVLMT